MRLRLQFRRYRLPLRGPVRTAHGLWSVRQGIVVRLEDEAGSVGFGEAAPIPEFGMETVDEVESAVRELGEWIEAAALPPLGQDGMSRAGWPASLVNAFAAARAPLIGEPEIRTEKVVGVAALVPAGRSALAAITEMGRTGFRIFKWKVGVAAAGEELALLEDALAALPPGGRLRLDANGAWNRRTAERWLERCADAPVEFVEQPAFARAAEGSAQRKQADDLVRGLAEDYPTPIALDESLVGDGDIERWLGAGWPGIYVVKPALLANPLRAVGRLARAGADVVFSSALETAVGARAALRVALGWEGKSRALGFGVWPLFADGRFDGPRAAPFLRESDIDCLNAEDVWNALI